MDETTTTLSPQTAADALGVSVFDLENQMRRASAGVLERLAEYVTSTRDRKRLEEFEEQVEYARRLLAAADACGEVWWADLGEPDE